MKLPAKDIAFVSVQLLLLIACAFHIPAIDFYIPGAIRYIGLVVALIGALIVFLSFISLNKSLTPFPSPKEDAKLVTTGIYKHVRHPIYLGVLMIVAGVGVYTRNTLSLLMIIPLLLLFIFKAKYEEKLLLEKFAGYKDYMEKTRALIPGIY